jgi:hypothetical protein
MRNAAARLKVSELVFTRPLNTGVFWLRCGDKVVRCSMYEFEKSCWPAATGAWTPSPDALGSGTANT